MRVSELRENLSEAMNRVAYGQERIVIERNGKRLVALVSVEDLEILEALEDHADLEAVKRARREGGKPVPWEKIKRSLGR